VALTPTADGLDRLVALVTGVTRVVARRVADGLLDHCATVYAGARDTADVIEPVAHWMATFSRRARYAPPSTEDSRPVGCRTPRLSLYSNN